MEISRRLLEVIVFLSLLIAYTILAYFNNPNTDLVGDLLKMATIAIISYEFGRVSETRALIGEMAYFRRVLELTLGFGLALIVQHFIIYGGFDPIWEDPLGHEWIGLYLVILALLGLRKEVH